jgi:hypothetical protein
MSVSPNSSHLQQNSPKRRRKEDITHSSNSTWKIHRNFRELANLGTERSNEQ